MTGHSVREHTSARYRMVSSFINKANTSFWNVRTSRFEGTFHFRMLQTLSQRYFWMFSGRSKFHEQRT